MNAACAASACKPKTRRRLAAAPHALSRPAQYCCAHRAADLWAIAGQGLPESGEVGLRQSEGREVLRSENGAVDECGVNERLPEKIRPTYLPKIPRPSAPAVSCSSGCCRARNGGHNAALAESLLRRFEIGEYFPHPRETYRVSGAEYIVSPLISEDYLLKVAPRAGYPLRRQQFVSTAALNVHAFPRTAVYAVRPAEAAFHIARRGSGFAK